MKKQNLAILPKVDHSFESALARLDQILEQMNAGSVQLDDSVKLYEEADQLIHFCNSKLNEAEQKVEVLMKDRQAKLILGADDKPMLQDFNPTLG